MLNTQLTHRISLFVLTLCVFNHLSCKQNDFLDEQKAEDMRAQLKQNTDLSLTSFVLEKRNNPQLGQDIVFSIIGDTLFGTLNPAYPIARPSFTSNSQSVEVDGVELSSGGSDIDFSKNVVVNLRYSGVSDRQYVVKINWGNSIPHIYIVTENESPIDSKENYLNATITINGNKTYNDFKGIGKIKGRGNSTWTLPKKPYRFKLDNKASLLGLPAEKDWVLLANYLDETHLLNAVALKIGKLIRMPFTNNIIPVEVTLNGEYQGCYMFTEQVEVKPNRVNVGSDGLLLNMDTQYEDPWQFLSATYDIPILIKDPELKNQAEVEAIKTQFEYLESLIASESFPHTNYWNVLDDDALGDYIMVQLFTGNEEINHPKSTYIHKTAKGKYTMGPLWDFDWAFGFNGLDKHFVNYDRPLFWSPPIEGTSFFARLMSDPYMKALVREKWASFRNNHYEELMRYIDDYAALIYDARHRDYLKWQRGNANYEEDVQALKEWLKNRAYFMESYIEQL
jgi:hypothetical protein